jgi:integrase
LHVFGPFAGRPLSSLTLPELQRHADRYPSKQSAAAACRYLRPILKWGAAPARARVPAVLAGVTPTATVRRRGPLLTPSELAAILPALRAGAAPYHRAMLFMLLTHARREEVCGARWSDIDLAAGGWRIPETKNGSSHRIPLSFVCVSRSPRASRWA